MISDILASRLWNPWTVSKELACELAAYLEREKPKTIVETGSGISTLIFARYAKQTGAKVYTLEHSPYYAKKTNDLLRHYGMGFQIKHSPLRETPHGRFYRFTPPKEIDFLLIDGPPQTIGRQAVFPSLEPYLTGDVWLDDASREHETDLLKKWPGKWRVLPLPKGLAVRGYQTPRVDASDVAVTLLTGKRPHLLKQTLDSLPPSFLRTAFVRCLHNGGDEETAEVLSNYPEIDELITTKKLETWEGRAASGLVKGLPDLAYHLHLEDDWGYATADPTWLDRAKRLLEDVGQVRLRHRGEPTLMKHQITKRPITWIDRGNYLVGDAHFTFNPALVRMDTARQVYPAMTESEAQEHFKGKVSQLNPGVFHHLGGNESLRSG